MLNKKQKKQKLIKEKRLLERLLKKIIIASETYIDDSKYLNGGVFDLSKYLYDTLSRSIDLEVTRANIEILLFKNRKKHNFLKIKKDSHYIKIGKKLSHGYNNIKY